MSMLVFLLEEPSAQDALEGILPRFLPNDIQVQYLVFEGKQDLERRMGKRMRGWLQAEQVHSHLPKARRRAYRTLLRRRAEPFTQFRGIYQCRSRTGAEGMTQLSLQ